MAEQLGEAVLKISADTTALDAGLRRSEQQAQQTARAIEQAVKPGRFYGPIPPPPPPLKLPQADTTALDAGLQRARQQAEQVGQALGQAFNTGAAGPAATVRSLQSLEAKLQNLRSALGVAEIGSRDFIKLQNEIRKTEAELAKATQASTGFGAGISRALGGLAAIAGIAGIGELIRQVAQTGQESERSKVQLQALAGAYGEAGAAAQSVARIQAVLGISALEARKSFSGLFASLRGTGLGVRQLEVLFVGVSKAAALSGAGTQEAASGLLQLKQGLAAGIFNGDELQSVLQNLPVLAQAVAKEMGVNVGQLKKLGAEGKITSDIVFNAAKSLAGTTVPGRTAAKDLGIAFTNLKEQAAAAFGPAVTELIRNLSASIGAFSRFVNDNREALNALGKSVVGIGKALLPLFIGIQAVRAATAAWALATKAVAASQALLLALQGPKGWAILALGIGAAAGAAVALDGAYKGVAGSVAAAKDEAAKAKAEFQKLLGGTELKPAGPGAPTAGTQADQRLSTELVALELRTAQERLQLTRQINGLTEAGRTIRQNELTLNEKIRAVEADRLRLAREQSKPRGTGDGQGGTQNLKAIEDLQGKIRAGQIEVATLRLQNQQADAAALRTQQERISGQRLEAANAISRLAITQRQTQLERDALANGREVSRTQQQQLQQWEAFTAAIRSRNAAQQALNAELSKPKEQQDRVVLDDLFARVARANEGVRQAYADAGLSLVQNARSAADALKSAQQGFNSAARGGFNLLTPQLQAQQIAAARASVQRAVDAGLIRTGIDISTPDKLFQVAGFAEQIVPAQKQLEQAIKESTAATAALAQKDWQVYVSVPGQPTFVPLPNT